MFKLLPAAFVLTLTAANHSAVSQQLVRYFELTPPIHKVTGSLYRHIEFMDSRPDTLLIGPIQIGAFSNIDARLVFKTPILPQLQRLMAGFVDSAAQDGTLLFQLRDFSFVEPIKTRYCFVKATLYAHTTDGYRKISTLNFTDVFDNSELATRVNIQVNSQLDDFVGAALTKAPADSASYTLSDIAHIDSIEKAQIPLYTIASFKDGIYDTYASFSKQLPDRQGIIKARRDGMITSVRVLDSASNKVKLHPKNVYAVVYKGKAHIATRYGYYPLERVRDNFFFTGDIHIRAGGGEIFMASVIFSPLAAVETSIGFEETYDLLIDPLSGNFIHLRRIEHTQTP